MQSLFCVRPDWIYKAGVFMMAVMSLLQVQASDTVERKISCEDNTIWIEDKLHIRGRYAGGNSELWDLFESVTNGNTNLMSKVRKVMQGEDIEIREYTANKNGDYIDLRILSTLKMANAAGSAKLHWLYSFGPYHVGLDKGNELQIFLEDEKYVLWVPEHTPELAAFREFEKVGMHFDENFHGDESCRCVLMNGDKTELLLSWDRRTNNVTGPSLHFLEKLNAAHKMSGNDELSLCTSLKVAKTGYYNISPIRAEKMER